MDLCHSLIFIVAFIIFTFPPAAVTSSGLTLENIFSFILGSEQNEFILYHIRRSTLTLIIHSFIPLLYYVIICSTSETIVFMDFSLIFWRNFVQLSLLLPAFICALTTYWYQNNWEKHPIAKIIILRSGCTDSAWRDVALSIDEETKSLDKFVSGGRCASNRLLVTPSWLVRSHLYGLHLASQARVVLLEVQRCSSLPIGEDDPLHRMSVAAATDGTQYLRIAVIGHGDDRPIFFHFQVDSTEYEDIKGRVLAPIRYATGVSVQMTLGEQFVKVFEDQVRKNGTPSSFNIPSGYVPEPCIGCSECPANVKLVRCCPGTIEPGSPECGHCQCRPMWCLACMGRWFASRQLVAQRDPSIWMSSQASCPTCRAVFCVLDVVPLS